MLATPPPQYIHTKHRHTHTRVCAYTQSRLNLLQKSFHKGDSEAPTRFGSCGRCYGAAERIQGKQKILCKQAGREFLTTQPHVPGFAKLLQSCPTLGEPVDYPSLLHCGWVLYHSSHLGSP